MIRKSSERGREVKEELSGETNLPVTTGSGVLATRCRVASKFYCLNRDKGLNRDRDVGSRWAQYRILFG